MYKGIWKFLEKAYDKMPLWVQIPTFIILLFTLIYVLLSPKFIDGELIAFSREGRNIPIPNSILEVYISPGRWIRLYTKTDGRFTLPIPIKTPFNDVRIRFYPSGLREGSYEAKVDYKKFFNSEIKLEYNEEKNSSAGFYIKEKIAYGVNLIPTANAQDKANLTGKTVYKPVVDDVSKFVKESASNRLNRNIEESNLNKSFLDVGLDSVDLAYIFADIRREYDLGIKSDLWGYAESLQDIIRFSREEFYRYRPWGEHDSSRINKMKILFQKAKVDYGLSAYELYQDARILRKSEKVFVAINILKDIVEIESDFYLAWFDLALAYRAAGMTKLANKAFEKAISLNESQNLEHAAIYNTYGRFLYWQCKPKESILYLKKTLEIKPDYGYTRSYIRDSETLLGGQLTIDTCK